jgi:transcriptional regulator with XRE-family HTH domain
LNGNRVVEWATKGCVYASFLVEWKFEQENRTMNEEQAKSFGDMLRQRRQDLGLSVRQVGAATAMNNTTISRIETGSFKAPRPDKLARIAEALGMSAGELFARAGYLVASDLPEYSTYLRTAHPDLPASAIDRLHDHFQAILAEFGISRARQPILEESTDEPSGVAR